MEPTLRAPENSFERFRERLLAERRDLFGRSREAADDLRVLEAFDRGEPEVEERAQEDALARLVARLEDRHQARLREINEALGRILAGRFGRCEQCGRPIDASRLDAIPWIRTCIECGRRAESVRRRFRPRIPAASSATPPVAPQYQSLSDEELAEAVREELRDVGAEALADVQVRAREGRISLAGEVPSDEDRDLAIEIVADRMALPVAADELRISRFPYETREETRPSGLPRDQPEVERGERVDEESEDVLEVEEKGIGYSPPDRPVRHPRKG